MTRKSTLAVAIAALLTPAIAGALGLGNIQVSSALNEPLQARIPVRGASSEDFGNLRARLGSLKQFERAGFDRPFVLTKLRFKVVETSSKIGYIEVTSKGPVAEPFLNFLIDVTWLNGRVIREYTLLLDPPVYGAALRRASKKQVTTVAQLPAATSPIPKKPTTAPTTRVSPQAMTPAVGSYGAVKSGETLWSIASRVRPSAVSIQAMMLAILKANPEAFSIDNVNALRTGSVLRIPTASEIRQGRAEALAEVARQHSLWREYRQSIGAPLAEPKAAAQAVAKAPDAEAPASGAKTMTQGADTGGELKLLAGSAQGSGSGTGSGEELQSLRDDLSMAREQADAARNENTELKDRLTRVESIVIDLNRLVDLKQEQLAALQAQLAKSQAQAPVVKEPPPVPKVKMPVVEPEVAKPKVAAPVVKKKVQVTKRKQPVAPPPQPTSTMDVINEILPVPLWTLLAGLGALLVGLGGLGFMRKRRAAAADDSSPVQLAEGESMISQYAATEVPAADDEDDDDDDLLGGDAITEVPNVPAAASLESNDISDVATSADSADSADATDLPADKEQSTGKMEAMDSGAPEDDPLAEFNVYLAYESFDQAEQLARNAIANAPDRHDYKSKLLEVFYASKNISGYETAAKQLSDAVGDDHEQMVQARDWWSDMGTGRELFAAGDSTGTDTASDDDVFDVTSSGAAAGEETSLDFDLGAASDSAEAGDDSDSSLDFDLGSLGDTGPAAADAVADVAGGGTGLDFDLGGLDESEPEGAVADTTESGDGSSLDFDLGALDDTLGTDDTETPPAQTEAGGTGLDFDLGGLDDTGDDSGDKNAASVTDAGDSGLDFDLGGLDDSGDDSGDKNAASVTDAGDNSLDFDLGDTGTVGVVAGASDSVTEVNDELDFDLGKVADEGTAAVDEADHSLEAGAASEASSGDMDLDFDLSDTMTVGMAAGDSKEDQAPPAADDPDAGLDMDLNMDLESTGGETEAQTDAGDLSLDAGLDLESSGAETLIQSDAAAETQEVGLDLESTGGETLLQADTAEEAADAGLDLGLDLDLESTGGETLLQADTAEESADAGLDLGLDLDLESTGGETPLQADTTEEAADVGLDLGLDLDLESTGGETPLQADTTEEAADAGLDLGLDLGVGDAEDESEAQLDIGEESVDGGLDLSLDMGLESADAEPEKGSSTNTELPDLSLGIEGGDFQDAETEVGDISDPDLMEDMGIEIPGQGQATSIDTVKLNADDVSKLSIGQGTDLDLGLDSGDGESEVGVDTEFRGIFPMESPAGADGSEESSVDFDLGGDLQDEGIGAGTSSSVDFDLGADFESADADSALADSVESDEGEEPEVDLDVTVFSLPNLPKVPTSPPQAVDSEDEDEDEDKTLVLGRSGGTGSVDDMQTKLDLAQAYMETGDTEGARNLLGEVMAEGNELQQATAREMLTKLS